MVIYSVDIDVSIVEIVDDDDQDDSKSDSRNPGFWTAELIAILMMVIIGLCVCSFTIVCMITFCFRKRQMSMFAKNESVTQVYSINSSEQSQSDIKNVQKDI